MATGSNPSETDYWYLTSLNHIYVTIKHEIRLSLEEHYFYSTNENPELYLDVQNTGIFNQQLGNISIVTELYSSYGYVESLSLIHI